MTYLDKIKEAERFIKSKITKPIEIGLILGSGLGELADEIEHPVIIDYCDIPHFPVSSIVGHKGRLVIGTLEGQQVLMMQGRVHFYEGYTMKEITFPIRVMKYLGISSLIVTNACGGINSNYYSGALMIINDHINLMGTNPLIGKHITDFGERFPDMLKAYDPEFIKWINEIAIENKIEVFNGVYAAVTGPNFETGAELKMLAVLGADTVGMSTVPEILVAHQMGIKALGISAITDMAIGENPEEITHEDVMKMANIIKPKLKILVKSFLRKL